MRFPEIPTAAYVPIGVVLGALVALFGVFFSKVFERTASLQLEERKARAARADTLIKEVNAKIAQLAADLGSASHSMAWLVWAATHGTLTEKRIESYDAEMHLVLPKVLGDVIAVASLDERLGNVANGIATELYKLDADLGYITILFLTDRDAALPRFIDIAPKVHNFWFVTINNLSKAAHGQLQLFLQAASFDRSQ